MKSPLLRSAENAEDDLSIAKEILTAVASAAVLAIFAAIFFLWLAATA